MMLVVRLLVLQIMFHFYSSPDQGLQLDHVMPVDSETP